MSLGMRVELGRQRKESCKRLNIFGPLPSENNMCSPAAWLGGRQQDQGVPKTGVA